MGKNRIWQKYLLVTVSTLNLTSAQINAPARFTTTVGINCISKMMVSNQILTIYYYVVLTLFKENIDSS